jgi:hypothetical protein
MDDGGELWRRIRVHVPKVVMHQLEVPEAFAGTRIQRNDRSAEEVGASAVGTVEIIVG